MPAETKGVKLTEGQLRRLRRLARSEGYFAAGCSLNQVLQSKGMAAKTGAPPLGLRISYAITEYGRSALADYEGGQDSHGE